MTGLQLYMREADEVDHKSSEALLRIIESSVEVRRRYQFFVWCQAKLARLIPHQIVVCGVYQRSAKDLVFEVFNTVPVAPHVLSQLAECRSSLMQQVVGVWLERQGRSAIVDLSKVGGEVAGAERDRLAGIGVVDMLVHGVSRPDRPAELESLFLFSSTDSRVSAAQQGWLDMLIPYLHSTYLRIHATERDMSGNRIPRRPAPPPRSPARSLITDREKQILGWVREGKSNQQIGGGVAISPLTVKNHLQKILRKLEAANRAQAVAKAMSMGLLEHSSGFAPLESDGKPR